MTLAVITAFIPTSAFADDPGGIRVTVTKTDIKADGVSNTSGYGSLKRNDDLGNQNQAGLVDKTGKMLFPFKDTHDLRYSVDGDIVSLVNSDAYVHAYLDAMYDEKTDTLTITVDDPIGFYHLDGTPAFSRDFWGATAMRDGYAFATSVSDLSGSSFHGNLSAAVKSVILDSKGQVVLELDGGFNEVTELLDVNYCRVLYTKEVGWGFSEGLLLCASYDAPALSGAQPVSLYYIDTTGKKIITLDTADYSNAWTFSDGLAWVMSKKNDKIGAIDKTGALVIPCEYDTGTGFNDGLSGVSKDGKYGYINKKNETVIPFEYDGAYGAGSGLASVVKDGKCGLVDYDNNVVVPLEYDDISTFDKGVAYAIKDGCLYIITKNEDKSSGIFGDLDGDGQVTSSDALIVLRMSIGLTSHDSDTLTIADIDGDGYLTSSDALELLRFSIGLSSNEKIGKPI